MAKHLIGYMFEAILSKYKDAGTFTFNLTQSLQYQCNAPTDAAGGYLIYKKIRNENILVYIGSSGRKSKNGKILIRKAGLKVRLVNGYHPNRFGETKRIRRHLAFPMQMERENINELKFCWWVTYDDIHSDFPTNIELSLRKLYLNTFKKQPAWHSERKS